jgi:dipeptidyl aminopeptidase/acylaminoacyl peptidase
LPWLVNVDGASQLRARNLITGNDLPMPELPAGWASELRITPDGQQLVMLISTATRPQNVLAVDLASGDMRWVTDARPLADRSTLVDPVLVHYPARTGRQVSALLYRPTYLGGTDTRGARHPWGLPMQERPYYSNDGLFQCLVSNGIAVFAPNVRGSSGYGLEYRRTVNRDWGGADLEDLDHAVRYLKNQPWVDPTRIGFVRPLVRWVRGAVVRFPATPT